MSAAWLAWRREAEANHLRWRSIVQVLVGQASHFEVHKEDERAALLARQAYLFDRRTELHELGPIDSAIRSVLQMPAFVSILGGHTRPATAVMWTLDGQTLTSVDQDGTVTQWDEGGAATRQITLSGYDPELRGADIVFFRMVLSPGANRVAVVAPEVGTIKLWDLRRPTVAPKTLETGRLYGRSLAFSKDEHELAAGTNDGTILVWRLDVPAAEPRQLKVHSDHVTAVAYSPDGTHLASCGLDGTVNLTNLATGMSRSLLVEKAPDLTSAQLVFRSDGAMLALAKGIGTVRVWDFTTRSKGEFWCGTCEPNHRL